MSISRSMICHVASFIVICLSFSPTIAQMVSYYQTGEEFVGPFSSWKNVKTDYGAKGDGSTNDAAAINAALVACKNTAANTWNVIYFPAGTYKINSTLYNSGRVGGDDYSGMAIIGEDPANTVISWGGADSSIMLKLDGWYMRISRLTFAGNSKKGVGISRDGAFGTGCEMSDLVFTDLTTGIDFSAPTGGNGQAENAIVRCTFRRCSSGMLCCNWNSLDEWVWYSLFEDCQYGIQSCIGYFQVYGCVFLRSTVVDINNSPYSQTIADNVSIGSKRFYSGWGYLRGNRIYNTTDTYSMAVADVMVDNLVRSRTGSTAAITLSPGNHLLIGNTMTTPAMPTPNPTYRYFVAEQKYLALSEIAVPDTVYLPGIPQNKNRHIFEVRKNTGNDASEIQKQIMSACSTAAYGSKAVVHIPKGTFNISQTITIPSKKDIQIIGDGSGSGQITRLSWNGNTTGPMIRCLGPNRVTIKDMSISVPYTTGPEVIAIENADQPGGRIYGNQFYAQGQDAGRPAGVGLYVDGVENSDVTLVCGGASGCNNSGILAKGGPVLTAGGTTNGQISLLSGAQSNCQNLFNVINGGRVVSEGTWYEGEATWRTSGLINLTNNAGKVSIACMSWHVGASPAPVLNLENFNGTFTFVANGLDDRDKDAGVRIAGNGTNCKVLGSCNTWTNTPMTTDSLWQDVTSPAAQAVLLNNSRKDPSLIVYDNVVNKIKNVVPDTAFILSAMEQLRSVRAEPPNDRPADITDVKFFRVNVSGAQSKNVVRISRDWTGVLDQSIILHNRFSGMTQKVVMMGERMQLPTLTKSVSVFDIQGRLIYWISINNHREIPIVEKTIAEFGRRGMCIVRTSK